MRAGGSGRFVSPGTSPIAPLAAFSGMETFIPVGVIDAGADAAAGVMGDGVVNEDGVEDGG